MASTLQGALGASAPQAGVKGAPAKPPSSLPSLDDEEGEDEDEEGEGLQDADGGEAFAVKGWLFESGLDPCCCYLALEDR